MRSTLAMVLAVCLAGCISAPRTPDGWETHRGNDASCAAVSGTFSGSGQSVSANAPIGAGSRFGNISLNEVLKAGSGPADAVRIDASRPGMLELTSIYEVSGFRGLRTLLETEGEFDCRDGVVRIERDRSGRILGRALETYGEVTRLLLSRSADGALLIEEQTFAGGTVLLVLPVGLYQKKLYRFPPAGAPAPPRESPGPERARRDAIEEPVVNCVSKGKRDWVGRSECDP